MYVNNEDALDQTLKYVAPWVVTAQVAALTALPLLLTAIAIFLPWYYLGLEPSWIAPFARGVAASIEWSVGTFVAVLLGFYAISLGGQLLAVKELSATRNVLGRVATIIASCAVLEWVFVIADAALNPQGSWGVVAALVVVVAIILFLAMHIGFRMNFDRREEIEWAVERLATIRVNVARLETCGILVDPLTPTVTSTRSHGRLVALLNGAVIVVTSLGLAVIGGALWTWDALWLVPLLGVLGFGIVFFGLSFGASIERQVGVGRFERYAMPALVAGAGLAVAAVSVLLAVGLPAPASWVLGGFAMTVGVATLTSCWPLRLSPKPVRRITVHAAAATVARARLDEDAKKQEDRIEQLEGELKALAGDDSRGTDGSLTAGVERRGAPRMALLVGLRRLIAPSPHHRRIPTSADEQSAPV
jgi:xanthosine utilization system XapX-like protein